MLILQSTLEMELNDYQKAAMSTCLPESENVLYMLLGLQEEVGELAGKFSKAIRHGTIKFNGNQLEVSGMNEVEHGEWKEMVMKELGDCLWMLSGVASVLDQPLESIARLNLQKLASRKERKLIDGSGDNR